VALPKQTEWKTLVKKFRALGWTGPIYGTKHPFMLKGKRKQRIPNPHDKQIGTQLMREILRQADISETEWTSAPE